MKSGLETLKNLHKTCDAISHVLLTPDHGLCEHIWVKTIPSYPHGLRHSQADIKDLFVMIQPNTAGYSMIAMRDKISQKAFEGGTHLVSLDDINTFITELKAAEKISYTKDAYAITTSEAANRPDLFNIIAGIFEPITLSIGHDKDTVFEIEVLDDGTERHLRFCKKPSVNIGSISINGNVEPCTLTKNGITLTSVWEQFVLATNLELDEIKEIMTKQQTLFDTTYSSKSWFQVPSLILKDNLLSKKDNLIPIIGLKSEE